MTIPFQNIPDTRPGYAFQRPGVGSVINEGMMQVLQAILAGTSARQRQQQLDQAQDYQQGLLRNEQSRQAVEFQKYLRGLLGQQEVGQALGMVGQNLPTGIAGSTGPLTIESVLQGVSPENRPAFLKEAEPLAKRQSEAAKKAEEQAKADAKSKGQQGYLQWAESLGPRFASAARAQILAENGELHQDVASQMFKDILSDQRTKEETAAAMRMITAKHPEWAALPPERAIALWMDEERAKINLRYQKNPKAPPLKPVPSGIVGAVKNNRAAMEAIDQAIADVEANPGSVGWANYLPGIAKFRGQVEPKARTLTRAAVERSKFLTIYDQTGKQVNIVELKQRGDLPDIADRPDVLLGKLKRMKATAQQGIDFFLEQYSPDMGFVGIAPGGSARPPVTLWGPGTNPNPPR